MFSALRNRLHVSPATVIATLALVFAMTGGAYAAKKYLITSTKQISPSVLKSLQGKAGPAGANGTPGAQGAQGPAGLAGPQGAAGAAGVKGETGAPGVKGATGSQGSTGATGAKGTTGFTETLPAGKTETGTWAGEAAAGAAVQASISFTLPTETAPTFVYAGQEQVQPGCPGIAANGLPRANPGKLCVYLGSITGIGGIFSAPKAFTVFEGEEEGSGNGIRNPEEGVGLSGAVLVFGACGGVPCSAQGVWAVTAEQ